MKTLYFTWKHASVHKTQTTLGSFEFAIECILNIHPAYAGGVTPFHRGVQFHDIIWEMRFQPP